MHRYTLDEGEETTGTRIALEVEQPSSSLGAGTSPSLGLQGPTKGGFKKRFRKKPRTRDVFVEKDKEIKSFQGLYSPLWKQAIFYTVAIATFGTSLLACKWSRQLYIALKLSDCTLKDARYVRITLVDGRVDLEPVKRLVVTPGSDEAPTLGHVAEDGRENLLDWQTGSEKHSLLEYRCSRYFYVESLNTFVPVPGVPKGYNDQLQRTAQQLASTGHASQLDDPDWDLADRAMRYGNNEMRVPVKNIPTLIFDEMWHPFYVFQYFSVIIWCAGDAYYSYSVCILVITWFSIISSAVETHQNMKRLSNIAHFETEVEVLRNGEFVKVSSKALVPGDIVLVSTGALPCDMVLLRGECIVDENMLTGESVPVRKVPYSPVADGLNYSADKSSACTLYGGTMVAQARAARNQRAVAAVCRTGYYSSKGQLLRSILFPKQHEESFVSDSLKFIAFMLLLCIALFIWAAIALVQAGSSGERIVLRFFDMVTIAVPPALPACLTIATVFSIGRLRKRDVFVTSPDRIAMAGQLDVICFDKTGTLTEQGLDLQGIVPVQPHSGGAATFAPMVERAYELALPVQALLASCHGLSRLDAALVGDPLDQKLFEATKWELIDEQCNVEAPVVEGRRPLYPATVGDGADGAFINGHADGEGANGDAAFTALAAPAAPPQGVGMHMAALGSMAMGMDEMVQTYVRPPNSAHSYSIIRRFEFNAALQRNMVVVKAPDGKISVYAKGSPEMIRTLVGAGSVPAEFDPVLGVYTREGLRVLALAQGDASSVPESMLHKWTQEEMEKNIPLNLVGLAVMANPLRPDSAGVIQKLQDASIRTVMVTGDHLRTAVSVSHLCHILPTGRPTLLVDGSEPGSAEPPFKLTILYPDGSVADVQAKASAAAAVLRGELECAVTGKGFNRLLETLDVDLLPACLNGAAVFARMSPDNKRDLMYLLGNGVEGIDHCPHLGLHVGFCGDGANDCGALKAAHVGVSLCEAEASVAAPMTSKNQTIASMVTVVAEGRCTLMATYQIFQFIIGYALVQAFETNLMYTYALNMGNYQYLIQDLFFTTVLAALMGFTEPRAKLSRAKPLPRVMSPPLVLATVLQLAVVVLFQLASLWLLEAQPGYVRSHGTSDLETVVSPENTVTYIVALAQFIILALVFNKGRPHRSSLLTNYSLTASMVAQVAFVLYSLYSIDLFNLKVQELVDDEGVVNTSLRHKLLLLMIANTVAAVVMEYLNQGGFVLALKAGFCAPLAKFFGHGSEGSGGAMAPAPGRIGYDSLPTAGSAPSTVAYELNRPQLQGMLGGGAGAAPFAAPAPAHGMVGMPSAGTQLPMDLPPLHAGAAAEAGGGRPRAAPAAAPAPVMASVTAPVPPPPPPQIL